MTGRPAAFAARLGRALDGLTAAGTLHVAAWDRDDPGAPLLAAADEVVTAASTIKVAVLAAALAQVAAGELDLAQRCAVPPRRAAGDGVLHALSSVRTLTLADVLTLMVIVSDNTAANMVISLAGIGRVNEFCAGAGLTGTVLRRQMMDPAATALGLQNTTTARDQATLLDAIAWRGLLPEPLRAFALRALERQQFRDGLPALLGDDARVAHKTGDLPGVRHDVGIVTGHSGRQAVVAVLHSGLGSPPYPAPPSAPIAAIGLAAWQALNE